MVDKLQSLRVLTNLTYCLPGSSTIFTKGWSTVSQLTIEVINREDRTFKSQIESDLRDLSEKAKTEQEPIAILGYLPPSEGCSRDKLRPLLLEMIRISQSRGKHTIGQFKLILT